MIVPRGFVFFFFNDTATPEIYTLSLHDALPIWFRWHWTLTLAGRTAEEVAEVAGGRLGRERDRKSTRLNSSHMSISYAVFCLKKKSREENQPAKITCGREGPRAASPPPGHAAIS